LATGLDQTGYNKEVGKAQKVAEEGHLSNGTRRARDVLFKQYGPWAR
jgi:hypothetical protein